MRELLKRAGFFPIRLSASAPEVALIALAACSSTAPAVIPIAGRTFDVVSIDGRTLPTTIKMLGRGSCNDIQVKRITLNFRTDGSFVESFVSMNDALITFNSGFVEPSIGSLVVIAQRDTATITDGVLRVKTSWDCGGETLIAQVK